MNRKIPFRPGDFAIFAAIILLACGIWIRLALLQTEQTYGEIWVDGTQYRQIRLADDTHQTITLDGREDTVTIEIEGKQMRFVNSHCADHTCEQTGWISRVGQTAVCLPNRVMIKITGSGDSGVDAVVQ